MSAVRCLMFLAITPGSGVDCRPTPSVADVRLCFMSTRASSPAAPGQSTLCTFDLRPHADGGGTMDDQVITTFEQSLRGQLVRPSDPGYDEVRRVYNGMIDKRPRLIARCVNAADVMTAVNFGRDNGLLVAIRGGGHNGAGLASVDDGLVIDLSLMQGVRVDPEKRTVRDEPGCTSGDVDHATHPFGLAVPFGIVSTTGVSGLTLGGGTGYLTRKYGLTIDNFIEADVVLADGRCVTASETQNPDLF